VSRIIAALGLTIALAATATACAGTVRTTGLAVNAPPTARERAIATELVARVNAERAARGLRPVTWDGDLAASAFRWSGTMAATGFRHSDIHPLLDRFVAAAENIGKGARGTTAGDMHVAWMRSDDHRHDVLAPNLDRIGIGVVCAPDGTMWATEHFGSTTSGDFGPLPPVDPIARPERGTLTC
jgi:uncharacterized protein YkwD